MTDIVIRANKWLMKQANPARPATDHEAQVCLCLLDEAIAEIHILRITLGKIARLGSNAPHNSTLDECGMLAYTVLTKERVDA